jgi:hypothetical protein
MSSNWHGYPVVSVGGSTSANPIECGITNKTIGLACYAKTTEASTGSSYAARFHMTNAGTGFAAAIMAKGYTYTGVTSRDTYGYEGIGILASGSSLASGACVAGASFTAQQDATHDTDGWLYCLRLADNIASGKDATSMGRSAVIGFESAGTGTPINRLLALEVAAIGTHATTTMVSTTSDIAATHTVKIGVYVGDTNTPTDLYLLASTTVPQA